MIYYRSADHMNGEDVVLSSQSIPQPMTAELNARGYRYVQPCADGEDKDHTCDWCKAQQFILAVVAAYYPDQTGLAAVRKSQAETISRITEIDP